MLNQQSPIPLYHQLADILTEQIRSNIYKPGDVIPSETRMAKEYKIGRPTVRQAMDTLVQKGLVERRRGSGTFVKQPKNQIDIFSLAGTSQAFSTKGIKTDTKTIDPVQLCKIKADSTNPFYGADAFFLSRLTLVQNETVLLEKFYLHPVLFSGLDKVNLENRSLSQVVSEKYYLKPVSGRQTFKIAFLSKKYSKVLGIKKTDPILEVQRTLNFPNAENAIFSKLYCRTQKFAFSQIINLEHT